MAKRLISLTIAIALPLGLAAAPAQAGSRFDEDQTQEIRRIVRDYLIRNPEVIVEALQEMRRRDEAAKQAATKKAVEQSRDAPAAQRRRPGRRQSQGKRHGGRVLRL